MGSRRRRKRPSRTLDFLKALVIVVLIGSAIRIFIAMPYRVKNIHMESGLMAGDFLLVNQLAYRSQKPVAADIVVFKHPLKVGEHTVGRVIATEGQTVAIRDKTVYVDNSPIAEPSTVRHSDYRIFPPDYSNRDNFAPTQVPAGMVFVLGDNRDEAEDSRHFGPIEIADIKGKGMLVYWSWRPDKNEPKWESPYIIPAIQIFFYNLTHFPSRIDWSRLGATPK